MGIRRKVLGCSTTLLWPPKRSFNLRALATSVGTDDEEVVLGGFHGRRCDKV